MLQVTVDSETALENDEIICHITIQLDAILAKMKLHLDKTKYLQATIINGLSQGLCYESDYTSLMMKVIQPGDTVIDIGANIGYFSLLASSLVTKSGMVISLEPESSNFSYLLRNIKLNNLTNITAYNIAAGETQKEVTLYIDPLNDGGHSLNGISPESIDLIGTGTFATSRVQMNTLDSLLASEKITAIKIIKMDTEGWEFNAIQGATSVIKRFSPPIILAEVNRSGLRRAGASEKYLRQIMAELGYSTYIATCLKNRKLVLELIPNYFFAEPELEHYNYNAVFARPEALNNFSACYHLFH